MSLEISAETSFALDLVNKLYSTQYQAVYDAMTNKPTSSIAAAQNTMVESPVSDGVWAKLDVFYLFAQYSNSDSEALKNWVNPGTFDANAVSAPTFTALEGFTGNGSSSYIDTLWNPNDDGVNLALDDVCAFAYQRTNGPSGDYLFGCQDVGTNGINMLPYFSVGTTGYVQVNDATTIGWVAGATNLGFYLVERTASNERAVYKNNVSLANDAQASTNLPDFKMYVLARSASNTAGSFGAQQVSVFGAGASLSSGERTALMNAIETYMDSNGKGIIT